jgi:glycosyltransferase involved in cell wall biosynthesis
MLAGRLAASRGSTIRIGVDARCLNVTHLRGMGNYLGGVIGALAGDSTLAWQFFSNRPDLPFHDPLHGQAPLHALDCPGHRFQLWEQAALPLEARLRGIEILHCPQNSAPLWQPVPTVITLHDTMIWDRDEAMGAGPYRDTVLPRAFARAAAIITISEQSKRDILRRWPNLAAKLHVIPHGVEPAFLTVAPGPLGPDLRALGVAEPYLLYCGGLMARKRLDWALEIFAALDHPALRLVVCGVPHERHEACRAALDPALRDRVCFAPFIAAEAMPRLYQNAAAVLYPTLYEGFGFPALEAQATGTPVLMSPLGSLAELAGPGAVMLDADDREAWIAAARDAVAARSAGASPNARARDWARRFTWEASAAAHHAVYRRAAGRG